MEKGFITKLKVNGFLIGSFDTYQEESKKLIRDNSKLTEEATNKIYDSMPTSYRASILNKKEEYIGFIGLFDVNPASDTASIRFEVKNDLNEEERTDILKEFTRYLRESLNIHNIKEFIYISNKREEYKKQKVSPKPNIIIPNKLLIPGISKEVLEKFRKDYSIPNLQMSFTIMSSNRAIGIIGLSNLLWPNKRANLNLFLDKELDDDITSELSPYLIDEYINFVHSSNIHSLSLSAEGNDENKLLLIDDTKMNYYATIPYSIDNDEFIESKIMFEHIPGMEKKDGIYLPAENKRISKNVISTDKKELSNIIELDNGCKLVRPEVFEEENISYDKVLDSHIEAMENRRKFTISLGDDKSFLQRGNEKYGLYKAFKNYTYIILDDENNYVGFINILRDNGINAEMEIGIKPNMQSDGIGTKVTTAFYEELFSIGYASITSTVFSFNEPSLRMHEKVAELNGVRLESYYINGKLWDMSFFTKANDKIDESVMHK